MFVMEDRKCAFVYILQCSDGSYYTGWSTNVSQRIATHNAGRASKYTRQRLPVRLVYSESQPNRRVAMKREAQIKKWSRVRKEALINTPKKHRSERKCESSC